MFQFPPNGKARVDVSLLALVVGILLFQFPPNGKARVDWMMRDEWGPQLDWVSIPSERESTCRPKRVRSKG